ncbi:MAG: hypothetical protein ACRC37_03275, partial [Lentisphaeria bacterium]
MSLIFTCIIFSSIMIAIQAPKLMKEATEMAKWASEITPNSSYENEKVVFSSTRKFPIESSFGGVSLYFNNEDIVAESDQLLAARGFWFTPSHGFAWITSENGTTIKNDFYKDGKLVNGLMPSRDIKDLVDFLQKLKQSPEIFISIAKFTPVIGLAIMAIYHLFSAFTLLIGLIILHRILGSLAFKEFTFGQNLSIYCYMSIPPYILATIWSAPLIGLGSFYAVFTFGL